MSIMLTLTCTRHSGIFIMCTVVYCHRIMGAVYQLILKTSATDIIQKDRTRARTKVSTGERERKREREREKDGEDINQSYNMDDFCLSRVEK